MSRYEELAGDAKLWVFIANRPLSDAEAAAIGAEMRGFTDSWLSHGSLLKAHSEIKNNLFLIFAADAQGDSMCGRAIDASVRFVKVLETKYGVSLLNRNLMAYTAKDGKVQSCLLSELHHLMETGEITPETLVFNNLVSNKNEFEKAWTAPLSESWQWRYAEALPSN
ncbi:MAG: ABC transporter ATPase [Bacteroidia bacterium]|jgi:predicted proteasome-type protease|nr:ABC transporter ATPase [Bacteroidia bacterium]